MAMLNDSFLLNLPTVNKRINLLLQNNGGSVISGKSVSPVGIDMGISQLLLDVRSKTNNFSKKRLLYFRPKLAAH